MKPNYWTSLKNVVESDIVFQQRFFERCFLPKVPEGFGGLDQAKAKEMLRFPMLCQAHCEGDDKVSKGYAKQNTKEILWETNGNPRDPPFQNLQLKGIIENGLSRARPGD